MAKAVISTIGRDRPGIVNQLSELITGLTLNIEDSRMTVLGGEFAVLMAVSGAAAALQSLEHELAKLAQAADFACLFRYTTDRSEPGTRPALVRVEAMDHPGIVQAVASFFSARNINIRELETQTSRAAHTGTQVFNLEMWVELPKELDLAPLEQEFKAFCEGRNLDAEVQTPA